MLRLQEVDQVWNVVFTEAMRRSLMGAETPEQFEQYRQNLSRLDKFESRCNLHESVRLCNDEIRSLIRTEQNDLGPWVSPTFLLMQRAKFELLYELMTIVHPPEEQNAEAEDLAEIWAEKGQALRENEVETENDQAEDENEVEIEKGQAEDEKEDEKDAENEDGQAVS